MAILLIRHPEPLGGAGICYGRLDLAPAPGWERHLADWLRLAQGAARAVVSPLARARIPGQALATALGLEATPDPAWGEMDFGAWEGLSWDAVPRPALDQWAADLLGARPHGGESVAMLRDRVLAGLAILQAWPGDSVVMTHAGPIRAVLAAREGEQAWTREIAFGSAVEVT